MFVILWGDISNDKGRVRFMLFILIEFGFVECFGWSFIMISLKLVGARFGLNRIGASLIENRESNGSRTIRKSWSFLKLVSRTYHVSMASLGFGKTDTIILIKP